MTIKQSDLYYEQIQQKLASANASAEASHVHGVVCGVIATNSHLPEDWFKELFDQAEKGDLLADEARNLVQQLYQETMEQIEGAGIGMQLLLPDDSTALPVRAQALIEWCEGFLYGIGLSGEQASKGLSAEAREALEDISELTRLDVAALHDAQDQEDEEDALMEITEFLWVAAMLIRDSFLDQLDQKAASHEYH